MLKYILGTIGIVGSFYMIVYRQKIGDMIGEADWMRKIGGVYMVVVITALFIFFWSLAEMTNTTEIFVKPFLFLFPGIGYQKEAVTDF